jgi:hypothetical protein
MILVLGSVAAHPVSPSSAWSGKPVVITVSDTMTVLCNGRFIFQSSHCVVNT